MSTQMPVVVETGDKVLAPNSILTVPSVERGTTGICLNSCLGHPTLSAKAFDPRPMRLGHLRSSTGSRH